MTKIIIKKKKFFIKEMISLDISGTIVLLNFQSLSQAECFEFLYKVSISPQFQNIKGPKGCH